MKKIYKVIIIIVFSIILLIPVSAFAQISLGNIQNDVTQPENKGCEYISETMYLPARILIQYPSTSDVVPDVRGENTNSLFASDFNNEIFNFHTEEADIWNIRLNIGYENAGAEPRNFFYEFVTGNSTQFYEAGNWFSESNKFCKILSITTIHEPHIKTTQEIVDDIAKWERVMHETTQEKQDATNDLIAIIVIAVVATGGTFAVIMIFMKINKNKEASEASYVSKQFAKQVEKFGNVTKYLMKSDEYRDIKVDYILTEIKQTLDAVMHGMNLHNKVVKKQAFTVHPPIVQSKEEKITKGLSFLDKAKDVLKDQLEIGTKKSDTIVTGLYNNKTTDEIYNELKKMEKELQTRYSTDEKFKSEYDSLMKVYKERISKQ